MTDNTLKKLIDSTFIEWKNGSEYAKRDYDIYVKALLIHRKKENYDEYMNYWKYLKEFKK